MVTVKPGRDPDVRPLEDYEAPDYYRIKLITAVTVGMALSLICIPSATLTFVLTYTATDVADYLGISPGWGTYWYTVTAMTLTTPIWLFQHWFIPDDFNEKNPWIPEPATEESDS